MDRSTLRADMIDSLEHTLSRPLSASVLSALRSVPRDEFVPDTPYHNRASEFEGTRVLAPQTVVQLLEALDLSAGDSTLIVGSGVGYTAAMIAEIVGETNVHAIDIDRTLVYAARDNLSRAGYDGVLVDCADGANGLPQYAPYDRIVIEAAVLRPPQALLSQLSEHGRIVYPDNPGHPEQSIVAADRSTRNFEQLDTFGTAQFRPLLVAGESTRGPERNRMHREDAEFATQGYFAKHGWEQEWIDWDSHL